MSANTEPASTEDYELHVVVAGDTLSRIAAGSLQDMKLWPQLWEQNSHIVNPHWIYPNDKILVKKVTPIAAATPPAPTPPPAPEPEPAPPVVQQSRVRLVAAPPPTPPTPARSVIDTTPPRTFAQVKPTDLYCSGFVRSMAVPEDLKVSSVVDTEKVILAAEGNYVNLSKGANDGIRNGGTYEVIRRTRKIESPTRPATGRNLGTHYLEIAQLQVVLSQDTTSVARVTGNCEPIEVGDLVVPYVPPVLPALPSRRPFSASIKGSGQGQGKVVMGMSVLLNASSAFKGASMLAGAGRGHLASLERGVAGEGNIVYIDVGRGANARPGDIFLVFRDTQETLSDGRKENRRLAVGELVILKVEDLASSALVTYSTDAIVLGDSVERR